MKYNAWINITQSIIYNAIYCINTVHVNSLHHVIGVECDISLARITSLLLSGENSQLGKSVSYPRLLFSFTQKPISGRGECQFFSRWTEEFTPLLEYLLFLNQSRPFETAVGFLSEKSMYIFQTLIFILLSQKCVAFVFITLHIYFGGVEESFILY